MQFCVFCVLLNAISSSVQNEIMLTVPVSLINLTKNPKYNCTSRESHGFEVMLP